jgi:glutamate synthase domain-containing protein 1
MARDPEMRSGLGELVVPMLTCMGERGPDSAGLAVFSDPLAGQLRRYSFYAPDRAFDWAGFFSQFAVDTESSSEIEAVDSHAILISEANPAVVQSWLAERDFNGHDVTGCDTVHLLSAGKSIDVYKDEGHPEQIAQRYSFTSLAGTHAVGHTRMATESAVSPAHAHPFTAGEDFCLVHNGSLSNPYSIRRKLEKLGVRFETDNDTEAACRFLEWRMRAGDTLEEALALAFDELDGFYTLLMATSDRLVLVRDAFACKPAVVAETDSYVAISSEYRALAHLPGVKEARIFEPVPEQIYSWTI